MPLCGFSFAVRFSILAERREPWWKQSSPRGERYRNPVQRETQSVYLPEIPAYQRIVWCFVIVETRDNQTWFGDRTLGILKPDLGSICKKFRTEIARVDTLREMFGPDRFCWARCQRGGWMSFECTGGSRFFRLCSNMLNPNSHFIQSPLKQTHLPSRQCFFACLIQNLVYSKEFSWVILFRIKRDPPVLSLSRSSSTAGRRGTGHICGQTLLLGVFENRHWVYLVKCWPIE